MLLLSRPGCSADGSALEWGSRGRWFKSSHSDQKSSISQEIGDFSCSKVLLILGRLEFDWNADHFRKKPH